MNGDARFLIFFWSVINKSTTSRTDMITREPLTIYFSEIIQVLIIRKFLYLYILYFPMLTSKTNTKICFSKIFQLFPKRLKRQAKKLLTLQNICRLVFQINFGIYSIQVSFHSVFHNSLSPVFYLQLKHNQNFNVIYAFL